MATVNNTRDKTWQNLMSHNLETSGVKTNFVLHGQITRNSYPGLVLNQADNPTRIEFVLVDNRCKDCGREEERLVSEPCPGPNGEEVPWDSCTRPKSWDWCETGATYEQLQEENERLKQELSARAIAATNLRGKLCSVATKLGHDVDELLADIMEITNVSK